MASYWQKHSSRIHFYHTHSLSHAHPHTLRFPPAVWLMRPGAGDGSIKEIPPYPFLLSLSVSPSVSLSQTCTWLIAVIWLRKGKWEIEKWRRKIGNNAADYKLCTRNKRPPSFLPLPPLSASGGSRCVSDRCLIEARRGHYNCKQIDVLSVPGCR